MNDLINEKKDKKEYARIHWWLRENYGKADKCEFKDCSGISKTFDWALKRGRVHEAKRSSYLKACRSCHCKYDWTKEKTTRFINNCFTKQANLARSITLTGMKKSMEFRKKLSIVRSRPILGVSIFDGTERKFPSLKVAAEELGVTSKAVHQALNGVSKKCQGYKFYYLLKTS